MPASYLSGFAALICLTTQAQAQAPAADGAGVESMLRVELDTHYVVDGRPDLRGVVRVTDPKRFFPAVRRRPDRTTLHIKVTSLIGRSKEWTMAVPLDAEPETEYPFTIPVVQVARGYNRLEVAVGPPEEGGGNDTSATAGKYLPLGKGGPVVDFAILERKRPAPKPRPADDPETYLAFVKDTVEQLIRHQSCRLGGNPDGVLFITSAGRSRPRYRKITRGAEGKPVGFDETYLNTQLATPPEFHEPYGADLDAWLILDLLSGATGEPKYARMVTEMAESFATHGFDPRSGLGYLGEEAQLDVYRLRPVNTRRVPRPLFKPGLQDNTPDLPLERLWKHAPEQTARMFKSMFYGLITDPEQMHFNRFCDYGFDDRAREHSRKPYEAQAGFESAGGRLIQWWGSCFARTGDRQCLQWARKMADKWQAVQHPESGLVPYSLRVKIEGTTVRQSSASAANIRGGSMCAVALLRAAEEFRKRPEGRTLADQLAGMGVKMARGVARHGYDARTGTFHESASFSGQSGSSRTSWSFHTQQERDEAIKLDPRMRQVPVIDGVSFYLKGLYSRDVAGIGVPREIAMAAWLTKDPELLERTKYFAEQLMRESREVTSAFTPEGKWTFHATGRYIGMLVLLYRMTGDPRHLRWARTLADREIDHLDQIAYPQWWRMRERSSFLEGLLRLHAVLKPEKDQRQKP